MADGHVPKENFRQSHELSEALLDNEFATMLQDDGAASDEVPTALGEVKGLWVLAGPLALQNFFHYCLGLISIMFVGRLGEFELSVMVLASSLYNVTGYALLFGFSSSIETLGGQAYGAGNYSNLGVILQQACVINTLVFGLVCAIWTQFGLLLTTFGQAPHMVEATQEFLWMISPAMWAVGMIECMKRYLMVQNEVNPAMAVTIFAVCIAPLYNWMFIFNWKLGLTGAAMAFNAAFFTIFILLLIYIIYRDLALRGSQEQSFTGLSWKAFSGWGSYIQLALPATLMIAVEWWTLEVIVLMSGTLPDPEVSVAVMGIGNSMEELLYMLPLGLSGATSTRIANYVGGNNAAAANLSCDVSIWMTTVMQLIIAVAMFLGRNYVGLLFTDLEAVVSAVSSMMLALAFTIMLDGISATMGGVLRGTGQQKLGALINVPAHWIIGIPSAWLFGFHFQLGVAGLWTGIGFAVVTQVALQGIAIARFNWEEQAAAAMLRISRMDVSPASSLPLDMIVTPSRASVVSYKPSKAPSIILRQASKTSMRFAPSL